MKETYICIVALFMTCLGLFLLAMLAIGPPGDMDIPLHDEVSTRSLLSLFGSGFIVMGLGGFVLLGFNL